jgi:hypothetical protein
MQKVIFSLTFFVSQPVGVQKNYKKRFAKTASRKKILYKTSDKTSKTDVFSVLFYHSFGRFSMRGVQKHDKKYRGNKSDPGPFLASDPPPHTPTTAPPATGVTHFVLTFVLPSPMHLHISSG